MAKLSQMIHVGSALPSHISSLLLTSPRSSLHSLMLNMGAAALCLHRQFISLGSLILKGLPLGCGKDALLYDRDALLVAADVLSAPAQTRRR